MKFDEKDGEEIVSNMPEISNENGVHTFDTTVKMSSYLLAFVFGDMQSKLGKTKNGTQVGVFATKAHKAQALDFPLDIAIRVIEFYEDYFKVAYPLPHSWHIGLPDFSAGAMENWGAITYREVALLADPDNSTLASRQYVALVIAHELAHQWFGDLVTMEWWDDLWLNESFANMMEYVAIDAIEPDWHIWEQFSVSEAPMALNRDAIDGVNQSMLQLTTLTKSTRSLTALSSMPKALVLWSCSANGSATLTFQQAFMRILTCISMAILLVAICGMPCQQRQVVMSQPL